MPVSKNPLGVMCVITTTKRISFSAGEVAFKTERGYMFSKIDIAYEVYGRLNSKRDNAILVCHALTGDAHAAGYHAHNRRPGWWDGMIGPGKTLDTNEYFVICSNVLGGCKGTTGPNSINPESGVFYGSKFPRITIRDMVRLQKLLIDYLKIPRLKAVIGGSLGGMQAIEWGMIYSDMVENIIAIATTEKLSPLAFAYNFMGIEAIKNDPHFLGGNYYGKTLPKDGLSLARMIGTVTYKSDELFKKRHEDKNFEIEDYLKHQGKTFLRRFDANSYITLCDAMNSHNIYKPYPTIQEALKQIKSKVLMIGIDTDLLYPPNDIKAFVGKLNTVGGFARYEEISSMQGHDAFLVDFKSLHPIIEDFLKRPFIKEQTKGQVR